MNNTLHNMNMVSTYLNNANYQLSQAMSQLNKFVNIDNNALYNNHVVSIENSINNQVSIIQNRIIPKIKEMD